VRQRSRPSSTLPIKKFIMGWPPLMDENVYRSECAGTCAREQRDDPIPVALVNVKIGIQRENLGSRMHLREPDQTGIRQGT
jgi:hypothetical protein